MTNKYGYKLITFTDDRLVVNNAYDTILLER